MLPATDVVAVEMAPGGLDAGRIGVFVAVLVGVLVGVSAGVFVGVAVGRASGGLRRGRPKPPRGPEASCRWRSAVPTSGPGSAAQSSRASSVQYGVSSPMSLADTNPSVPPVLS